jgi:hypothetical protein
MSATQAPLSGGTAALIGLAALGVIVLDAGWRVVRHLTVMAHEGGHAVIGWLAATLAATLAAAAEGARLLIMRA